LQLEACGSFILLPKSPIRFQYFENGEAEIKEKETKRKRDGHGFIDECKNDDGG
jgi:hypothetical protein